MRCPTTSRRAHYDAFLLAYHDALGPDAPVSLDDVRDGVRRATFFGVMMAIVSSMLVARTERGDEMFMTMLRRHCQHVLDTGALDTLPDPVVAEPLTPTATDEGAHPATGEPLWSESWYLDFADPEQGIGGWMRLGLMPNEGTAWVTALLCGPDIPTIAVVDFEVPVPADPGRVSTDTVELTLTATEPLRTYRVSLRGRGEAYDDPAALLRGESGRPVQMTMDLVWATTGRPYQYRITPRYEIPCTVSGTVTADGREFGLRRRRRTARPLLGCARLVGDGLGVERAAPRRRHPHPRVDLRIPGAPPIGVGYVQRAGDLSSSTR